LLEGAFFGEICPLKLIPSPRNLHFDFLLFSLEDKPRLLFPVELFFCDGLHYIIFVFFDFKEQRHPNYFVTLQVDESSGCEGILHDEISGSLILAPSLIDDDVQKTLHTLAVSCSQVCLGSVITQIVKVDPDHRIFGISL